MNFLFTVILLALPFTAASQVDILMQDGITNPALSLRCKELHKERSQKIKMQQRLNGLLQRGLDLIKQTPPAKETVHARLQANQLRIRNELHLTNLQIESMEENLIRSGCPGLSR